MLSIIIPVHNCIEFTKKCIESIEENTSDFEIIIIDNGSYGDDKLILQDFQKENRIKLISFDSNKGYPKAINKGFDEAQGNYICILNNDVIVTPEWANRLINHLENCDLVGPCSNFVSGKQCKQINNYDSNEELYKIADNFYQDNKGKYIDVKWIIGFCMLFKKSLLDKLGYLDDRFGMGNSDDIDFCIRAKLGGHEIHIAEDVFIHHDGHVTFKYLDNGNTNLCQKLCAWNRIQLYKKWGDIDYRQ